MSQRFIIQGARKDTGDEQQLVVEADDLAQAETIASIRGLFVSAIKPIGVEPTTQLHALPRQAEVRATQSPLRSVTIIAGGVILGLIGLTVLGLAVAGITSRGGRPDSNQHLLFADQQFLQALRNGQLEDVKRTLQDEPNLKVVDPKTHDSALSLTIRRIDDLESLSSYRSAEERRELAGWKDFADVLVKAGADVNGNGTRTVPPLNEARTAWTINFLLDHGASVNGSPQSGTPLYWKSSDIWYEQAALLLSRGADPNLGDFEGKTPLHKAAAENQTQIISLLLKSKAQINKRDSKGYTPLKRARLSYQKEAASLLQQSGGVE